MRRLLIAMLLSACCLVAGCAVQGGPAERSFQPGPDSNLPAGTQFPRLELPPYAGPDTAVPLRSALFTDAQRRRDGSGFEDLQHNRVLADGSAAVFAPAWEPGAGADKLAYAVYRLELPGYADSPLIRLLWDDLPAEDKVWLALPQHELGRWEWFKANGGTQVEVSSLLPYLEQDNLYFALVLTGDGLSRLEQVIVGDDVIPLPVLGATPVEGPIPLDVSFSAALSSDPDGSIVKYEWDLEGDGVFELDSGELPEAQHSYELVGSYSAQLRVTDDKGATAIAVQTISANPQGMEPPVAMLSADPLTGPHPLTTTLDASGSTDDVGIASYDFDFNGDGYFELGAQTEPVQQHTYSGYSGAGMHTVTVRVNDLTGASATASVVVDSDAQPLAHFTADSVCDADPLTLFDASNSYELGGSIVSYRWDYEGDGIWDETNSHGGGGRQYPGWGQYQPTLEVTDDDGDTNVRSLTIRKAVVNTTAAQIPVPGAGLSTRQLNGDICAVFEDTGGVNFFREENGIPTQIILTAKNPPDTSQLQLGFTLGLNAAQYPFAVFYNSDGDLVCARATKTHPLATGDWKVHNIDSASSNYKGNFACSAVSYGLLSNARILVSYYDESDQELYFAVSETAYPDEESDWTRHIVDSNGQAGKTHSLALINGKPAIAYYREYQGNESIIYAKAAVANPDEASDWTMHPIYNWLAVMNGVSLTTVNAKPAVSFILQTSSAYYAWASSNNPGSSNDWNVRAVRGGNDHIDGSYTALMDYGGIPVLAYRAQDTYQLIFAWCEETEPGIGTDWCEAYTDYAMATDFVSGSIRNGKPLVGIHRSGQVEPSATVIYGK